MKQAFDALVAQLLESLQKSAGGDKGAVTGQQDIKLIDQTRRSMGKGCYILFAEQSGDELVGNEVGE